MINIIVCLGATFIFEKTIFIFCPNELTYIKVGEVHRLENKGKLSFLIIEVQFGESIPVKMILVEIR